MRHLGSAKWLAILCLVVIVVFARDVRAANYTWSQFGNGSYDWSTAGNWATGTAVSNAGNTVIFGGTFVYPSGFTTTSNVNNGGASFVLNSLQLTGAGTGSGGALTITGDPLDLQYNGSTAPRIANSPAGTQKPAYTIANNIVVSSGTLELNNGSNTNGTFTLSGSVSGAGALWKTGNGTLYLAGTSTFTGDLLIQRAPSGGGVVLTGAALLGASGTYAGNILTTSTTILALTYQSSQSQTLSGTIYGGGSAGTVTCLEVNTASGTLRLLGNNTYSGTTTVRQGTLVLGNANALGSGTAGVNAGTLLYGGTIDVNGQSIPAAESLTQTGSASLVNANTGTAATWAGTVSSSGTLGVGGAGNLVVAGVLGGAGSVSKTGAGTVTLANASYSGTTGVTAGTLVFGAASSMSPSGAIAVASGATLGVQASLTHDISGSGLISVGPTGALSAASIGTNGLSLQGSGTSTASFTNTGGPQAGLGAISLGGFSTLTLSTTSALASAGSVSITGTSNSLAVSGLTSAGNTYTLLSGASLTNTGAVSLTGAAVGNQTIVLGGSATVGRTTYNFNQTSTALQLAVTGTTYNLFWNGGVSGAWNYSTAAWQQDGAGSSIVFVANDNASLGASAAITLDAGGITAGTVAVNNAAGSVDLAGGQLSATALTKSAAGTATIANNVTVAQGMSVSDGALANSGTLAITAGGLNVSGGAFSSTSGVTVSAGGLNVSGGSATLAAASTITGGITVTGGTAALNAANSVSGAVAVSGGGVLSLGNTGGAGSSSLSLDNGTLTSSLSSPTIANAIALGSGGGTVLGGSPLTLSGAITGPGTLAKAGAGELTVSGSLGTSTTGVAVSVAAGAAARLTGAATKWLSTTATGTVDGTLTFDNATLVLKSGTVLTGTGTIALIGASTLTGTSTSISTIAAPISGSGSLAIGQSSAGNSAATTYVTLSGNNSYSGGTTLNQNVGMGSSSAFGSGLITAARTDSHSRINNVTGGPLALANNVTTGAGFVISLTGAPIQLTGTITGSGIIRASSSGIIDLTQQTASTMQNTGSVDMGGGGTVWTSDASNFGSNASILFSGTGATLIAKADTGSILQNMKIGATGATANVNANIDTGIYGVTLAGVLSDLNSGTTGGLAKFGTGTLTLTGNSTFTQATAVAAGRLLVNGSLYSGAAVATTTVASAAALGGSGTIGGSVVFSAGANFAFDAASILTVNGASVSFGSFSIANVLGLNASTPEGTYTLMNGLATFDLTNVSNVGSSNAASIGGGKTAYLQQGSLQLVVVPEPSTVAFVAGGLMAVVLVARRKTRVDDGM